MKPEGWLDNEPKEVDDPESMKPEDWNDDEDGKWEPREKPNPRCDEVVNGRSLQREFILSVTAAVCIISVRTVPALICSSFVSARHQIFCPAMLGILSSDGL